MSEPLSLEDDYRSGLQTLVVDLDGTLLRSNMLFESFWSAFGRDWRSPFMALAALSRGRAYLKRQLALASAIETATLPYDSRVIGFVQAWRAAGGRTALVTACDRVFAKSIAAHLGIFDEVHGSDGKINLKGDRKGRFLEERFGSKGFAYMGDTKADLHVWKRAGKSFTVNAPASLCREAECISENVEHLVTDVDLHFNLGLWHFARERYTPIETQCRGVSIGV